MKQKLFWFTMVIAMLVALFIAPQTANAATYGIYTYSVYNGEATITDCSTSASGSITIPSTLGGYPVTSIGYEAFKGCTGLTSITIPDSVTSIGSWAFRVCAGLTSITIPDSVTNIGSDAFYNCIKLTSITIPDSVTSIGDRAFYECTGLAKINWNAVSVSDFTSSSYVFYNAGTSGNGIEVVFGDSVQKIPAYLFRVSNSSYSPKVTSVTIGNNVTSIGSWAFEGCTGLEKINWNAVSVSDFTSSSDVFYDAGTSGNGIEVVFGDNVQKIPAYLFYVSYSLYIPKVTSVTIGTNVTSIGDYAFFRCTSLTSITISDSVTSIGNYAFRGCTGLTSITIPDSVTSIGYKAFYDTAYYNDNSNWENDVLYIGNHLIAAKETLSGDYTIKDGTKIIGDDAFYNCTGLTSITIPDSVTSIGNYAFEDCTRLTSITIPDSVTSIGGSAFEGCTGLEKINWNAVSVSDFKSSWDVFYNAGTSGNGIEVVFGDNVQKIPAYLFYDSNSSYIPKVTSVTVGNNVTSIGDKAFYECTGITSITIPDSVTSIGDRAFYECTGLEKINWNAVSVSDFTSSSYVFYNAGTSGNGIEVVFGDSVQKIPAYLFYVSDSTYRPKVTSVTIGNNVTSIGKYAFRNCTGLEKIYWNAVSVSDFTSSSYVFYNAGTSGNGIEVVFGDSVQKIPAYLFYVSDSTYRPKVTSVTIGNNVTSIGESAFYECTGLTSITIGDSVTSIGKSAFYGCIGITSITIPDSVTSIGYGAFSDCTGLTSITIPDSVTSIGNRAFYNCTGLEKTNWNAVSVSDFASSSNVFYNAGTDGDGIEVVFGDSVQKIPAYLFTNSSYVTSVIIGNNVTSIGSSAFYNCTGITSIIIPDSVTSIGYYAFYGCTKLTSIIIPDSVTSIEIFAFYNCTGLTSITIPDSVTSIGSSAFERCTGLTSITIPDSVTSIGNRVFYNCTGLEKTNWNAVSVSDFASSSNVFYNAGTDGDGIEVVFGDSVQKIPAYLFTNSSYVTSVIIGNNVTSIGNCAFEGCTGLTSITIPDSVTSIGSYAFGKCSSIMRITISDGVKTIGDGAFNNCIGLSRVVIPDSVTSIGSSAFKGCTGIIRIKLSQSLTNIGEYAFGDCTGLTEIAIPESVSNIGSGAFRGCNQIIEITIPSSIKTIGANAFPEKIKKAYVSKKLAQLPKQTFVDYAYLELVVFYGKQTQISIDDFYGCNKVVLSGYPGSYAETYADNYLFDFIPMEVTGIDITATSYASNQTIIIYADISEQVDKECLHIALFNSSNALVDYIIVPSDEPFDSMNVAFKDDDNATYAKVFLWENMISAQPIADAVRVDIAR